jgi:autotransporter-associated beta strand protein
VLNGPVSFSNAASTITVESPVGCNATTVMTIGGTLRGVTTLTKDGLGTLALTNANTGLTGGIVINDGLLTVGSQYALGGSLLLTPYTAGPTVTLNGGGYNVNVANTLFQNAVVLGGNAVLSATAANTALAGVTLNSGATALGIQGGNTNTLFGGLTLNGASATTLFTSNDLRVFGNSVRLRTFPGQGGPGIRPVLRRFDLRRKSDHRAGGAGHRRNRSFPP